MPNLRLKQAAEELAKQMPDYAGQSAFPPSAWWIAGDQLMVIGADGRKFAGPLPDKSSLSKAKKVSQASQAAIAKINDVINDAETKPPVKKTGK